MLKQTLLTLAISVLMVGCAWKPQLPSQQPNKEAMDMECYSFPSEERRHEGTWLIWPHSYSYGGEYQAELEPIWVEMVQALHTGERVHIVAYNSEEQKHIEGLLRTSQVDMAKVDFVIAKSDDVWARDTGPIFAFDQNKKLTILDYAFDGWGKKTNYKNDDLLPQIIAENMGITAVPIPELVIEGGAVELDGAGTLMACKSSVISSNRNPNVTQSQAEAILQKYMGVENFIWLEGVVGQDITDAHIDGTARFVDDRTILTLAAEDFFELYDGVPDSDYEMLLSATNLDGKPYAIVEMPLTIENVEGLEYRGSYINYYVGNDVVLLPVYNDINDNVAIKVIAKLYPERRVVPIDVTALYQYGGMLHCVTQQQPIDN